MLTPDPLTRRERLRLEALAQAIAMTNLVPPVKDSSIVEQRKPPSVNDAVDVIIGRAVRIEKFLLAADTEKTDA